MRVPLSRQGELSRPPSAAASANISQLLTCRECHRITLALVDPGRWQSQPGLAQAGRVS